jgi:hypothetical protein
VSGLKLELGLVRVRNRVRVRIRVRVRVRPRVPCIPLLIMVNIALSARRKSSTLQTRKKRMQAKN